MTTTIKLLKKYIEGGKTYLLNDTLVVAEERAAWLVEKGVAVIHSLETVVEKAVEEIKEVITEAEMVAAEIPTLIEKRVGAFAAKSRPWMVDTKVDDPTPDPAPDVGITDSPIDTTSDKEHENGQE